MSEQRHSLVPLLNTTVKVLEWVSSIMLAVMMVLTLADVIGRYVFNAPIFGASEMITQLMAMVIFSGLGICNARDDHVFVGLFDGHFRVLSPRLYEFLIQGLSIAAMTLIAYVLFEQAVDSYHHDSRTVVLDAPLIFVISAISLLSLISVFSLIAGLIVRFNSEDEL